MTFLPGQFVFLSVQGKGVSREEHPFSISSDPQQDELRICAKIVGDYTLSLLALQAGDPVTVAGPHGRFGRHVNSDNPLIMVAGGIGITPFLSMIPVYTKIIRKNPVYLFHTVKNPAESMHHEELNTLTAGSDQIRYLRHVTGESGRLTARMIMESTGLTRSVRILLCGPGPMMYDLSRQFAVLGVRRRNIEFEDFNFR
jgi:predicted ferric reductase